MVLNLLNLKDKRILQRAKSKKKKYVKMYKVLQNFLKGLDEDVIDDTVGTIS